MDILDVARRNQQKAWEIIEKVNVIPIWESIGAQVNLVGSLRMGLLTIQMSTTVCCATRMLC